MKVFMVTVDVRNSKYWIPGVLKDVALKSSSPDMALKRAMRMAKQALPKGTRILEVNARLVYLCTEKPVESPAVAGSA